MGQLNQHRWSWGENGDSIRQINQKNVRDGQAGSFLGLQGVAYSAEIQRIAVEESRLGIPLLLAQDVIHGWRTTFPTPLGEASSWDPALAEKTARVAAVEASAQGLHWTFAPMVDVARDPRWGRIVEGAGEDPYLGGLLAAARVRGFQGTDLSQPNTILACAKHFAAYGGAEAGRDYNIVDISPRTLFEIYLPPFHRAVEAGVATVMGAFNEVNGVPMHANGYLINEVLRNGWGFRGLVVSDYTAIMELQRHGVAATPAEAGILGLTSGVDVDMVSEIYHLELPQMVREGRLSGAVVDQAARRVLEAKYRLGLFEDPFRYHNAEREKTLILHPDHLQIALEAATKSIVLLKNDHGILPLPPAPGSLAVIGALAADQDAPLGPWRGQGMAEDVVSVLSGIREKLPQSTSVYYQPGYTLPEFAGEGLMEAALQAVDQAEAVILVVGETARMSGEASNRTDIGLPGDQLALAKAVLGRGKPTVVVLMNGRPLAIPWLAENAPAILETWFLGVRMGPAVAKVLFGEENPGGKLPVTFPRVTGQIPIYYNHRSTGRPPREDDFFSSKYLDAHWTPQFPFGFGLSYTTFAYDGLAVDRESIGVGEKMAVRFQVRNTGTRKGDEVVQCYLQDNVGSVTRPVRQLVAFERITLQPGEAKTMNFTIYPEQMSFYNSGMQKTIEPGQFTVFVGGSSTAELSAGFEVVAN